MGRPRKMETCDAVSAAMGAFWHSGYKGTSLADLESATGLKKGSLYKAFDDKHDLFVQALEMYIVQAREALFAAFDGTGNAIERLQRGGNLTAAGCADQSCLAIKTLGELGSEDPEVREILQRHWRAVADRLNSIILKGQEEGSIRTDLPSDTIVPMIVRIIIGTVVAAPITDPEQLAQPFSTLLTLIKK